MNVTKEAPTDRAREDPDPRQPARPRPRRALTPSLLAAWSVALLACASCRGAAKPLWYDELFSATLIGLPRLVDLWSALVAGVDLNPPLSYLAGRAATAVFGPTPWALRLPSALGFVLLSVCLYRFVARRLAAPYAWTAALFPAVTQAWFYASEARPYALLLGLSGVALVAWQAAADGRRRPLALAALSLALALAVSTHYFAVLVFIPLGIGELVRTRERRRLDPAVWIALGLGLAPLPLFAPLMRASKDYGVHFWSKIGWTYWPYFYSFLVRDAVIAFVPILAVVVFDSRRAVEDDPARERPIATLPRPEVAVALGFTALPLFGFLLARLATGGAYSERYALPAVIGPSLLLAYGAASLDPRRRLSVLALPVVLAGWFLFVEINQARQKPKAELAVHAEVFRAAEGSDLPIVATWSQFFLQAHFALPPALGDRLVYLEKEAWTDSLALRKLSSIEALRVESYDDFVRTHPRYFVCGAPTDALFRAILERPRTRVTILHAGKFRDSESVLARVETEATPATASSGGLLRADEVVDAGH